MTLESDGIIGHAQREPVTSCKLVDVRHVNVHVNGSGFTFCRSVSVEVR